MNVLPSLPLVRAVSILSGVWCCIVLHTRGMRDIKSWFDSSGPLPLVTVAGGRSKAKVPAISQGKMRENGQRGSCHQRVGGTQDRRLRLWVTADWGRYRLGLLSVVLDTRTA